MAEEPAQVIDIATQTLSPGEWLVIEVSTDVTAEEMQAVRNMVPEEIVERTLIVAGTAHILRPPNDGVRPEDGGAVGDEVRPNALG